MPSRDKILDERDNQAMCEYHRVTQTRPHIIYDNKGKVLSFTRVPLYSRDES